jgi:hypothetical protein
MITLPFEVIERLLAVHHAAHDRDDRSPQTTGVLLSVVCGVVTVAATDGMILVDGDNLPGRRLRSVCVVKIGAKIRKEGGFS